MKRIIYTARNGDLAVVVPVEGGRLALSIQLSDGTQVPAEPPYSARPVDTFMRRWPIEGAIAVWAETEDEFIARIGAMAVPRDARDVQVVTAESIPQDRTFRNAWKVGAGRVEHDMEKCREIHKQRLRQIRQPLLEAADVEFMRAIEDGDAALRAAVVARKAALRDVTKDPAIAAAQTPDALKAVLPAALTR